jgi:NADH dehydrogenase (ubiquinone) 1 alpha subcomplex subunit 9
MLVSPSSVALRAAAAAATAAARPVAARSLSTHVDRSARVSPAYNAGRGGYSSNKGVVATVFGATGFLGRYVVDALASTGITCIIPYRGSDMEPRHLKLMGDLGRVNPIPFDPRVVDSVREVVRPAQLVVNLIGKDFETKHALGSLVKNYTYEQVHAEVPRMLAQVCAEQNVHQLIHVSSLAARPGALSKLDESKLLGEIAVKTNFPAATIIKPANMFGDEDRFLNKIAKMARGLPRIAMVNNGAQRLQPV